MKILSLLLIVSLLSASINFCLGQPVITSFRVSGKETPVWHSVRLSETNNSFSVDYTLPGASTAYYAYILQGFDTGWTYAGGRTFINYTNLPGGNYIFKLKASTDNNHWIEIEDAPLIYINTPFYKTPWLIALLSMAIVGAAVLVIFFASRVQLHRILMAQKLRNNIASDLHDDIGSSLSSIMLMSEAAKKQPQQAATYLKEITETAHEVIENMNDIVWAINPGNDSMEQILIRMQRFASTLLEQKNISLRFDVSSGTENLKLGMEERKNFYLIFKETIHNACKYAECKKVMVHIKNDTGTITMKITDDGKGFDTSKKYRGNGLYNLQKRAAEINGKLELHSANGNGTETMFVFKTTQTGGQL